MTTLVRLIHAGVGALWLGAMAYSLFVVQPRLRDEDTQRQLAHGNRWPVTGMIALLWLSGALLVALHPGRWPFMAAKALLLAGASALFWWVSWRAWPRRVFALPEELPALQRRFRLVALLMFGLVGAAYALGVISAPVAR